MLMGQCVNILGRETVAHQEQEIARARSMALYFRPVRLEAGDREPQGPVYVVSVVGSKMYGVNDRARTQSDKGAADTQLCQQSTLAR